MKEDPYQRMGRGAERIKRGLANLFTGKKKKAPRSRPRRRSPKRQGSLSSLDRTDAYRTYLKRRHRDNI